MANDKVIIKYSDLIEDDGAFEKLVKDYENLKKSLLDDAKKIQSKLQFVDASDAQAIAKITKQWEDFRKEFIKVTETLKSFQDMKEKSIKVSKKATSQNKEEAESVEELTEEQKREEKILKDLEKQQAKLNDLDDERVKNNIKIKAEIQRKNKQIKIENELNRDNLGTLEKIKAESNALRLEREKLNLETEEGVQRLKEINQQIDENNEKLVESSDKLKQNRLQVGGYADGIKDAAGEFGGLFASIKATANEIVRFGKDFGEAASGIVSFRKETDKNGKSVRRLGVDFKKAGTTAKILGGTVVTLIGVAIGSTLGKTREGAGKLEASLNFVTDALNIIGTTAQRVFSRLGDYFTKSTSKISIGLAVLSGEWEEAKQIALEYQEAEKRLEEGASFGEIFSQAGESLSRLTNTFGDATEAQRRLEDQTAQYSLQIAELRKQEAEYSQEVGAGVLSFDQQIKAQKELLKVTNKRIDLQEKLARGEVDLAVDKVLKDLDILGGGLKATRQEIEGLTFLDKKTADGTLFADLIQPETFELLEQTLQQVKDVETERVEFTIANRLELIQIEQDLYERNLDFAIDAFDAQKTLNERQIADERKSIKERQKILDKTTKLSKEAYDNQIKLTEDFLARKLVIEGKSESEARRIVEETFDLRALAQLENEEDIRKQIGLIQDQENAQRDVNDQIQISDIVYGRVLEIIRENKAVTQDIVDLNKDITQELNEHQRILADIENQEDIYDAERSQEALDRLIEKETKYFEDRQKAINEARQKEIDENGKVDKQKEEARQKELEDQKAKIDELITKRNELTNVEFDLRKKQIEDNALFEAQQYSENAAEIIKIIEDRNAKIKEIEQDETLTEAEKEQRIQNAQEIADKELEIYEGNIEKIEEIIAQKNFDIRKLEDERLDEIEDNGTKEVKIVEDVEKKKTDIRKQSAETAKKLISDVLEQAVKSAEEATQAQEEALAKQGQAVESQRRRAEQGLENTLQFEEEKLAEEERKKIDAMKREERRQKVLALWTSYQANSANEDIQNPLIKTLQDWAMLEYIAASFDKGGVVGIDGYENAKGYVPNNNGVTLGPTHNVNGGVLAYHRGGEGFFSYGEMQNLGLDNFYAIKNMANRGKVQAGFMREQVDSMQQGAVIVQNVGVSSGDLERVLKEITNSQEKNDVKVEQVVKGFVDIVHTMKKGQVKTKTTHRTKIFE